MTFQQYIQQKNLDISIVDLENLENHNRFDAEFYAVDILWLRKKLKNNWSKKLWLLSSYIKRWVQPKYDLEWNIKVLRSVNIREDWFSDNRQEFVKEDLYNSKKQSQVNYLDIFMTSTWVWTLWRVWISLDKEKYFIDSHITKINNLNWFSPEFLFVYLNSSIWQKQINTLYKWSSWQIEIYPDDIEEILVPIVSFQDKIANLVQESYKQKELSKKLYLEAEKLLLSELWLEDYKPTEQNISIKDSEEVELFWRVDAEFFQPKYDEIIEKIKDYELTELWNIVDFKKWIEPWSEAYDDFWIPFIRVSDVSVNWINKFEKYISTDLFDSLNWKYQPEKWDILFTKDWTIWISFVFDEDFDSVLSSAFLIFKTKIEINKYYLALVLNSIVCKLQIERFSWWALIEHLKPSDVNTLKIPILWKEIQEKISYLVLESKKSRILSKQLLEKAKKSVEIFIEEDEEKAGEFLEN